MRKRLKGKKFSRNLGPRKALFRNLVSQFFLHEEIKTTLSKAKAIKPLVEKLITKAGRAKPADLLVLSKFISQEPIIKKLLEEIGPRYKKIPGGYTRILKLGPRRGDSTEMAIIKLVEVEPEEV